MLSELGRKEEAIACYDRALEIDPRFTVAWNAKGRVLSDLGRKEEAVVCYDQALEIGPRDVRVWANKARALSDLGRREQAVEAYRRLIACVPTSNEQLIQGIEQLIAQLEANPNPRSPN